MFSRHRFPVKFVQALVVVVIVLTSVPMTTVRAEEPTPPNPAEWKYVYNPPVVSLFSGAATYNYPIEVPPGRGGLQPSVNLSYSSRRADGLLGVDYVDAGPLGVGWSVDQMDIVRTEFKGDGCGGSTCCKDDRFVLMMNGTGYELEPAESEYWGRFYAKDAPGLYVERRNFCDTSFHVECADNPKNGSPLPEQGGNLTGDYWIVRMPDGTEARLGYTLNSEQVAFDVTGHTYYGEVVGYIGRAPLYGAKRWRVDTITDVHGNKIEFRYWEYVYKDRDAFSLLEEITYNRADDGTYLSRVLFGIDASAIDIKDGKLRPRIGPLYTAIEVWDGRPQQRVRRYELDVMQDRTDRDLKMAYLRQIRLVNRDGQALPATTFGYHWLDNWESNWYPYPRLGWVDNGYGGRTAFVYDGGDGYRRTDENPPTFQLTSGVGQTYRVIEEQTYDGVTAGAAVVRYEYGGGCRGEVNSRCADPEADKWATIVGHEWTRVRVYDYDWTPLAVHLHRFHVDYDLLGREYQVQVSDGGGTLLKQTDTAWSSRPNGTSTQAHADEVVTTDYSGGASASTRVAYEYDPYGNVTVEKHHGNTAVSGDERSIHREYLNVTNNGRWLIGLKWKEEAREGIPGDTAETQSFWYYDGYDPNAPPGEPNVAQIGKGQVTAVRSGLKDTPGEPFVTTRYGYDPQYGNLTDTWDPLEHNTRMTYDSTYHLFPTQTCAAEGIAQRLCSYSEYYGVNNVPADYGLPGQVRRVWDDNGTDTATEYRYDAFGRLTSVIRPDDTPDKPTVSYTYTPVTELLYASGFESSSDWTKWNTGGGYSQDDPYAGAWSFVLSGPNNDTDAGAIYTNVQPALQPYAAYRVRFALKGTEGRVESNVATTNEGWPQAIKASVKGGWRVVEGSFHTGGNPGNGKFHIWVPQPRKSVNANVDQFEVHRVRGLVVTTRQREVSGQDGVVESYTYYDGLGRAIQSRAEAEGGQWAVASTAYDGRGLAVRAYVPRFEGGTGYTAPGGLYTATQYDALGRAVRVDHPDGTRAETLYEGWTTTGIDGNGHMRTSRSDGLGRLVEVGEPGVSWSDSFDDGALNGWSSGGTVAEANGVVRITGTGSWGTNLYRPSYNLGDGQWLMLDFKYDPGSVESAIFLDAGVWAQPGYRRWGLRINSATIYQDIYEGTASQLVPLLSLRTGVWYRALLKVGGEFVVSVWERDNPAVRGEARQVKGSAWNGLAWHFMLQQPTGVLELDRYEELGIAHTTRYGYDTLDNLTTVTDTLNNTTVITYNVLGLKTGMRDPDMGQWAYRYDAAGNLETQTDAKGQLLWFKYDPLNRLTEKRLDGSGGTLLASYTYDCGTSGPCPSGNYGKGRRTSMTVPGVDTTAWSYDLRGRVLTETKSINDAGVFVTGTTYDALDRVVTMAYPDGEVVTHTYNGAGALKSLSGQNPYVQNATYNALGQITALPLGNGLTTQYTYNQLNFRLERVATGGLLDLRYQYDPLGNVTRIEDWRNGSQYQTQTFTYDALDRLTRAQATGAGPGAYDHTYAYDPIGNIDWRKEGSTMFDYGYPTSGPGSVRPHAVISVDLPNPTADWSYSYDPNGNMTTRTECTGESPCSPITYNQTFNAENKLVQVSGAASATFFYDGDGNRVLRVNPDGSKTAYVGGYFEVDFKGPNAPGNLVATVVSISQIKLTWMDNSNNEEGFKIERSPNGSSGWVEVATVGANATSYTDGGLACNTTYYYRVRAYNAVGYSGYSNTAGAATSACPLPPNAPSNLVATPVSNSQIRLTWADNSNNEDSFKIERSPNGSSGWVEVATVGANATSYTDGGLACNTTYYYRVRAYNTVGYSGYSNTAGAATSACPLPPNAPGNLVATVVSSSQIKLTWTDNSNNESGFKIERSPNGTSGWAEVATVGANATSYTNGGLACNTTYYYRVRACRAPGMMAPPESKYVYYRVQAENSAGISGYSNVAKVLVYCSTSPQSNTTDESVRVDSQATAAAAVTTPPLGQVWRSYYTFAGQRIAMRVQGDPDPAKNGVFYLHGDHLGSTSLATSDVQVTNLALGKPATQSSTPYGTTGTAAEAVDGDTNGQWGHGSVTHTNPDTHAWWQVDLGSVQPIRDVVLWNRTDCCSERLSNFYVFVSDTPFASTDLNATLAQAGVSSYYVASLSGDSISIRFNRTGRYVRVQLAGTDFLSLAEVEVWGGATGGFVSRVLYYPYGEERPGGSGTLPTDFRFTGQRQEGFGLYDYVARFYDPLLGRFVSADTIVPGAASSAGGGLGTIGYSEGTRLTPLTVGFHEIQFLGILNAENQELLQFGPPALWDGQVRQEHNVPMGPANPQALNRFSYCLGNPLRYVDPTGHYTLVDVELSAKEVEDLLRELDWWIAKGGLADGAAYGIEGAGVLWEIIAGAGWLVELPSGVGVGMYAVGGGITWTNDDLRTLREELSVAAGRQYLDQSEMGETYCMRGVRLTLRQNIGSWDIEINGNRVIGHSTIVPPCFPTKGVWNATPLWLTTYYVAYLSPFAGAFDFLKR